MRIRVAAQRQGSGLPTEGQLLQRSEGRGGIAEADDADAGEAAATVAEHDEVGEGVDIFDAQVINSQFAAAQFAVMRLSIAACGFGDDDVSTGRGRVRGGDVDELEIGAVAVVGDEESVFTADDGVLDGVFDSVDTGPDLLRFGFEVVDADDPVPGGRLRPGDDEHHPART